MFLNRLTTLLFLFGFIQFDLRTSNVSEDLELDRLSIICFRNNEILPCRKALEYTELLQRFAAAENNYSCQTNLLGLGAYLVMSNMKLFRQEKALLMLSEARKFCRDLE